MRTRTRTLTHASASASGHAQSVMMPEDGSAGGAAGSKAASGIKAKMTDEDNDDKLKLEGSLSVKRTTIDMINELKIAIEKIINSNLWQGECSHEIERREGARAYSGPRPNLS